MLEIYNFYFFSELSLQRKLAKKSEKKRQPGQQLNMKYYLFMSVVVTLLYNVSAGNIDVTTNSGEVMGYEHITIFGGKVFVFTGIPYAKPPIGELRFKKPKPIEKWKGKLNATSKPNACFQKTLQKEENNNNPIQNLWKMKSQISEDCLYLNIFVPENSTLSKGSMDKKKPGNLLPVMFFIHGGNFQTTSGSLDIFDGSILADRMTVIVVTMNYRLGPFGFMYNNEDLQMAPGNQGLMDQQMALAWVKDNVINFGGDPKIITLFGDSTGAASVGLHLMMKGSKGLFARAIMESMSPLYPGISHSEEEAVKITSIFSKKAGCYTKTSEDTMTCLRRMDPEKLIVAAEEVMKEGYETPFLPTYGSKNNMIPKPPLELAEEKMFNTEELLIGSNQEEGSRALTTIIPEKVNGITREKATSILQKVLPVNKINFAPKVVELYMKNIESSEDMNLEALSYALGDYFFYCPTLFFAEKFSKSEKKVYYYMFNYLPKRFHSTNEFSHGDEVEFVFGVPLKLNEYTFSENELSLRLMLHFTTFAKQGNPSLASDEWPRFQEEWPAYQELNTLVPNFKFVYNHLNCDIWREIIDLN
ncbi:cholinesterase-like [Tachypleus tridentatus]|uniref:cholinesterase-like n=1 Tax=Tachypleus tridentatus TaxID=6853 RepID=UPI003FD43958